MCRICHLHADDRALVRATRLGDHDAFAEIHRRYRPRLERFAAGLVARRGLAAEDVVQDVFVRAHSALLAGERDIELRPWLFAITRNRAFDVLRRAGESAVPEGHEPASADADPGRLLERREHLRDVLAGIAGLPPRQREALLEHVVGGRSGRSVGRDLGISETAVRTLAHRARAGVARRVARAA